jgi:parallel beta-helix repeat protein
MRKSITLLLILVFLTASSITTLLPVKAEPKTIVVPDDYATIPEAIGNAVAGDTVFVKKGTYSYPSGDSAIWINKPLSLIGEDSQTTVITRTEEYMRYTYNVIHIASDNVTVSGFTIKGNQGLTGIRVEGSGIKIIGNNIVNCWWGILTYGGTNYVISQNNISANDYGISFKPSNSVISGNSITGNHDYGLKVARCQNVTIKENTITGIAAQAEGLAVLESNNIRVYKNNITDLEFGISVGSVCNNTNIHNNRVMRNGLGINILNNADVGSGNKIYYNNFVDNTQNALVEENVTDVFSWDNEYVGNYWSDYQSRYPNATEVDASGIGDTSYVINENNVDHYPLMQQVNTSTFAPTPTPPSNPEPTIMPTLTIAAIVIAIVVATGLLSYLKKRKH